MKFFPQSTILWGPAKLVVGEMVLTAGSERATGGAAQQSWESNRNTKIEKIASLTLFMGAPFLNPGLTKKRVAILSPSLATRLSCADKTRGVASHPYEWFAFSA
jgi:hypothetical protein